jgi:F-type H+-transporting ATPase subunit b
MSELFSKLGLDWHLLLAQAANFLVLLVVLYLALYKPLLKILKERRAKIEEGLMKAEEADKRLRDANEMAKEKMLAAEEESLTTLRAAEERGKSVEAGLIAEARKKEALLLEQAVRAAKGKEEEAMDAFRKNAGGLIRQALVKAVGMRPESVDEALVAAAVEEIKNRA